VWFRQAIDNLIDNALRHSPPAGHIDVRANRKDGTISVIVEDTGPGFAEGFIEEAFEPFARSARTRSTGGTQPGSGSLS
jgi:signal transduction histidine kinase